MKRASVFLLLLLICNLIFLFPKIDYSPVPVEWSPGIDWGRYYIVNEGRIYEEGQDNFLTWQSSLKNYGSEDVLPKIYYAIINLVTGTTLFPNDLSLHYKLPWIGSLLLPLIVLSFYHYLAKRECLNTLNSYDELLVYAFSAFPLVSTLSTVGGNTNGSALGRALFLLLLVTTIIIFNEKKRNAQRVVIFLILCISSSCYYHTWSYYTFICLLVVYFFIFLKSKDKSTSLLFTGIIIFIASCLYFNYKLFYEPIHIVHNIPSLLTDLGSVSYASKIDRKYLGYTSFSSYYGYFQFIGLVLILLLCFIYIYEYICDKNMNPLKAYDKTLFYILISESFIGAFLFLWDGFSGLISRFFESLVYVSMLISVYLLIMGKPKIKFLIRSILILSILISVSCYLNSPKELHWELTNEEFKGIEFSGMHIENTSYIFSDFRLAPPLLYFGKLAILTIDGSNNLPQTTAEILEKCYYNVSNPETILDKIIPCNNYYFLLSSHQTEIYLLDTSLKRLKQVPQETLNKWNSQSQFNKVYDSEYFYLYMRKP